VNNKFESTGKNYYINRINIKKLALKDISKKKNINIESVVYKTGLKSISKINGKKETYKSNSLFIDRPFIFIIQEKHTDAIVFIGQIVDP
jgi:serine protease inhibitor